VSHINVLFSSHGHTLASHNRWPVACIQHALNFRCSKFHHTKPRGFSLSFNDAAAQLGSLFIHSRKDFSEWVISPSQRSPRTQHTTNTWDDLSCSQQVLKARSRWSSGRRPTPQTARPPVLTVGSKNWYRVNLEGCFKLCVVCISVHVHSNVLYAVQNHPILALHNQCIWKNVITKFEQQLIIQKLRSSCAAPTERSASSWLFCRQRNSTLIGQAAPYLYYCRCGEVSRADCGVLCLSIYRGLGRRQVVLCLAGHQITSKPRVSPPDLTTTQYHVIINFRDIQWMTNETQISKTAIKTEDSSSPLILVSYAASELPQRIRKTAAPVFMYCLHNVSHRYNRLLLKWHRTSCLTEKLSPVSILRFVCRGGAVKNANWTV